MNDETCHNVGTLIVGGKTVGLIRCGEPAGHELETPADHSGAPSWIEPTVPATPHRAILEWTDDELIDWPEANDPNEVFDVEVPIVQPGVPAPLYIRNRRP